jgi:polysaccharide export outer membrane protein
MLALLGMCMAAWADAYRLGPEDIIQVHVLRHPEYSGEYFIPADGTLAIPGIGQVMAGGITLEELTALARERLRDTLREPDVTITLKQPRMQRVYVLGSVLRPGVYDLKTGWRIAEALAAAGGTASDAVDARATVYRGAGDEKYTVDIAAVLGADARANLPLRAGDIISVTALERLPIFVMGAVKNPGLHEVQAGHSMLEALALAGGPTIPDAEIQTTVIRDGQAMATLVDLKGAMQKRDPAARIPLQRGDVVQVSSLRSLHVMVAGQVRNPGAYELRDGDGLLEAITLAGGITEEAAMNRIKVVHQSGKAEIVDITPAMLQGEEESNIRVQPGDLIIVPQTMAHIAVLGFVNRPGHFSLREGVPLTLVEALTLADGVQPKRSALGSVAILRNDNGSQQRIIADVRRYLKTGDAQHNPIVQPGDIIYVPESGRPDWGEIFQTLASFSILNDLF